MKISHAFGLSIVFGVLFVALTFSLLPSQETLADSFSEGYEALNVRLLSHRGGALQAVAAQENYLYIAEGTEFVVLNSSR